MHSSARTLPVHSESLEHAKLGMTASPKRRTVGLSKLAQSGNQRPPRSLTFTISRSHNPPEPISASAVVGPVLTMCTRRLACRPPSLIVRTSGEGPDRLHSVCPSTSDRRTNFVSSSYATLNVRGLSLQHPPTIHRVRRSCPAASKMALAIPWIWGDGGSSAYPGESAPTVPCVAGPPLRCALRRSTSSKDSSSVPSVAASRCTEEPSACPGDEGLQPGTSSATTVPTASHFHDTSPVCHAQGGRGARRSALRSPRTKPVQHRPRERFRRPAPAVAAGGTRQGCCRARFSQGAFATPAPRTSHLERRTAAE